jgi:hypothetical protein
MIKRLYGMMKPQEKGDYSRILAMEINSYLDKIYKSMKRKARLTLHHVKPSDLSLKHASLGTTKAWEFRLNSRQEAAKGNVGKVVVVTRGLKDNMMRKQRALFIAAEWYVYHAFASHHDKGKFRSIRCQNQHWDMFRRMVGRQNPHDTRDQAIRYVVEEIGEHKLAHYRPSGWVVSIAKLKRHYPDIAQILGSSEKTFKEVFRKQHQKYTPAMLLQEEDLLRKEIEDMEHLIKLLQEQEKQKHGQKQKKLMQIHIDDLKTFQKVLKRIVDRLDKWVVVDKKEHKELRKAGLEKHTMQKILLAEAEAEEIDINKVHIVFDYFKKEKINILRDLELLDYIGAKTHKKHKR